LFEDDLEIQTGPAKKRRLALVAVQLPE
jgi:hypothetical protein